MSNFFVVHMDSRNADKTQPARDSSVLGSARIRELPLVPTALKLGHMIHRKMVPAIIWGIGRRVGGWVGGRRKTDRQALRTSHRLRTTPPSLPSSPPPSPPPTITHTFVVQYKLHTAPPQRTNHRRQVGRRSSAVACARASSKVPALDNALLELA